MKNKKVKKGFTLVELLAAITIMGIIIIMAIPSLGSLATRNRTKRYENYAKTLISSGKVYVDSNSIDIFGYEESGCYDITFEQLESKKLIKDMEYKDITCADKTQKRTFVRVKKVQNDYEYQVSIICVNSKKHVEYQSLIDDSSTICSEKTSHDPPTITITPEEVTKASTKEESKVTVKVEDIDGLLENTVIEYAWSTNKTINNGVYQKINYKNTRNVKKTSQKITIPHDGKIYYLFIKPVSVKDVFNNENTSSQVKGPYQFDIYPPSCGTITGASKTWTNGKRTISVACIDNESGCKQNVYTQDFNETATTGQITIEDNYGNKTLCPVNVYIDKKAPTCGDIKGNDSWTNQNKSLSVGCSDTGGSGCFSTSFSTTFTTGSKSSITIKDNAGNTTPCSVTPKIDKNPPTCDSISGASTKWTNGNRNITVKCKDTGGSNCQKTIFSNNFTTDMRQGSIIIKDNANNTTKCTVNVYIDKTPPTIRVHDTFWFQPGDPCFWGFGFIVQDNLSGLSNKGLQFNYTYGTTMKPCDWAGMGSNLENYTGTFDVTATICSPSKISSEVYVCDWANNCNYKFNRVSF